MSIATEKEGPLPIVESGCVKDSLLAIANNRLELYFVSMPCPTLGWLIFGEMVEDLYTLVAGDSAGSIHAEHTSVSETMIVVLWFTSVV